MIRSILWILLRRRAPAGPSDPRLLDFARGLALGALVGAAIAGSSIWSRRRRRGRAMADQGVRPAV